jgi:hypothetical protein
MKTVEPLIPLTDLRSNLITNASLHGQEPTTYYDPRLDTMTLLLVQPRGDTFVYYIDGDMALVCDMETLEVLGFRIEGFVKEFLPKQANRNLAKAHAPWRIPEPA